ncbi:MAG: GAF domain-containing protein [Deltaproteobacteria bacterium]|nr:GAF domain-containing protein [Deltaproteobacteria bacterium]
MAVTYKQVGEGCKYTIEPMYSGSGEVLTIENSKRREPARSGLMLQTNVRYPLGTLVQMDIKFPGQEYTYRAKGIVSWIDASASGPVMPMGVTITGMDKLDRYGISVSISEQLAPPPTPAPALSPAQQEFEERFSTAPPSEHPPPYPPDEEASIEFEETSVNPLYYEEMEMNPEEEDMESTPELFEMSLGSLDNELDIPAPPSVESMHQTRIQNFFSADDMIADTIPPSLSWENQAKSATAAFDKKVVTVVFQILSLMIPHEGFGERVYFEDVLVPSIEPVPKSLEEILLHPGKRSDFTIRIEGGNAGKMCAVLASGDKNTPPSSYVIEQLLLMYTGMAIQVIRDKDIVLTRPQMACIARLASPSSSMRAVMGFDQLLLSQLIRFKDGPVPLDDNETSFEALSHNDRTSRVSLVVAANNEKHRKTVPIEARVSVAPSRVSGPMSSEIGGLVVEAFESMEELYGAENHDDAAKFALSLSRRLIKCEAAICVLLVPDQSELYISAIDGAIPETRLGARLSITDGLIGFCMRTGKVARSDQPKEIKASLLRETGLSVDNIVCAPIVSGNSNIGAIQLMNSTAKEGFTRETADLLAYIATSLGDFLAAEN